MRLFWACAPSPNHVYRVPMLWPLLFYRGEWSFGPIPLGEISAQGADRGLKVTCSWWRLHAVYFFLSFQDVCWDQCFVNCQVGVGFIRGLTEVYFGLESWRILLKWEGILKYRIRNYSFLGLKTKDLMW